MIGQPGVLSRVPINCYYLGNQRTTLCSFRYQFSHEGVSLWGGVKYLRSVVIYIRYEDTHSHVAAEWRRTVVSGHHLDLKAPKLFVIKRPHSVDDPGVSANGKIGRHRGTVDVAR
ncbi:unnamed protein product [Gadus morhua 'NCC']